MKRILFLLSFLALLIPRLAMAACFFTNAGAVGSAHDGNVTLNAPSSPQINDVWIAVVSSNDNVAHAFTDWTAIYNADGVPGENHFSVWYHRYAGSTPNLTVSHTAGEAIVGGIAQLRGCDQSESPVDTLGTADIATDDNTPVFNGITPSTSNTLLLAVWGYDDNLGVSSGPSGFTQGFVYGFQSNDSAAGAYLYYKSHISGATGSFGATMNPQGSNDESTAMLIAIEAEAAAATSQDQGSMM